MPPLNLESVCVCVWLFSLLNMLFSLLLFAWKPVISRFFRVIMFSSVQFSSVAQSCLTVCDPMNHSTPGLPVHLHLLEFTVTHVHWVGDAIQPSHPLSSPSPPPPSPFQHQSLFQWVNSSHEVAKVLEFSALASVLPVNTQDWSGWGVISPQL